jgi:transglutaminase-like putative cysteine protease
MRLSVDYQTRYTYSEPVRRVIQLLRVTPPSFIGQHVLDWRIDVDSDARLRAGRDGFGNVIHMLYVDHRVDRLTISVSGQVLTEDQSGLVEGLQTELPPLVFTRETRLTCANDALRALGRDAAGTGGTMLDKMHWLMARIHGQLRFDTNGTHAQTTAAEAFAAGHGVCQDLAHIFISAARTIGVPARYVSGHIFRRDGAVMQEAAHAWAEAWIENLGWTSFDPANGVCADDAYIRIASGLDYLDAAPIAGARAGGGEEDLRVEVQVKQARVQTQA